MALTLEWDDEFRGLSQAFAPDFTICDACSDHWVHCERGAAAAEFGPRIGKAAQREWYDKLWT